MQYSTFPDIEFYREAFVLVPEHENSLYKTVLVPSNGKKHSDRRFCSCSKGRTPKCSHIQKLADGINSYKVSDNYSDINDCFQKSMYRQLFGALASVYPLSLSKITLLTNSSDESLQAYNGDALLLSYFSQGPDRNRFIGRVDGDRTYSRAWLMAQTITLVESEHERTMRSMGHLTVRQVEEAGIWYRLAYHCFREFDPAVLQWRLHIDGSNGKARLNAEYSDGILFTLFLPSSAVSTMVASLRKCGCDSPLWSDISSEKELQFTIVKSGEESLCVSPVVEVGSEGKATRIPVQPCFCYGTIGYLPDRNTFFTFSYASLQRSASGWNREKTVPVKEISRFLEEHSSVFSIDALQSGTADQQTDLFGMVTKATNLGRIVDPPVITAFDFVELAPQSVENGVWTITLFYKAGNHTIHCGTLIAARKNRDRFCYTDRCIVDLKSDAVADALAQVHGIGPDGTLQISGASLMVLNSSKVKLHIEGNRRLVTRIRRMFSGKPDKVTRDYGGIQCSLRDYQHNGVAWLMFLYDNFLGGLLCDEMGLGKTVQVIALLTTVKMQRKRDAIFCIICPTTVVNHWSRLLQRFAPTLRVVTYTAFNRSLPEKGTYDVVLTSYGIMRNDIVLLENVPLEIVVFDEVQQLKNRQTVGFEAACRFKGKLHIGMTGTPVENSIDDLKNLFDLVLPGFSDNLPDESAIIQTLDTQVESEVILRFKNRINPFILRRLKESVLIELPPKIEDVRYCMLSDTQQELYNEAVVGRGSSIIETLRKSDEPIPYMHIFALLSYLKQVCNSPALVRGNWEEYVLQESGKWELFKELLDESLQSGEKVVVFTQFLNMVEIICHYVNSIGVNFVALTGKTRNRAKVIQTFSDDEKCKVFIGSLKAGGVGIDLVAATVVIHYDRWWNAAKEDQATDRVHRIGQTRGVQVFKLITENTIEERIAAIIERKRTLSQQTLVEDDPESIKQFSRHELIELLSRV